MKKALGAIPKIPRWPKIPKIPGATNVSSEGMPGMASAGTIPGKIIDRIAAAIGRRSNMKVGSEEHIQRLVAEFPLDRYRDAEGKVRCPISQERRNRLKSAFDD